MVREDKELGLAVDQFLYAASQIGPLIFLVLIPRPFISTVLITTSIYLRCTNSVHLSSWYLLADLDAVREDEKLGLAVDQVLHRASQIGPFMFLELTNMSIYLRSTNYHVHSSPQY